jgi:hypothetical protein
MPEENNKHDVSRDGDEEETPSVAPSSTSWIRRNREPILRVIKPLMLLLAVIAVVLFVVMIVFVVIETGDDKRDTAGPATTAGEGAAGVPSNTPAVPDSAGAAGSPTDGATPGPGSAPTSGTTAGEPPEETSVPIVLTEGPFEYPEYTLAALQDEDSPQSKGDSWLRSHPEIDTMPEWKKQQLFAVATMLYACDGWPQKSSSTRRVQFGPEDDEADEEEEFLLDYTLTNECPPIEGFVCNDQGVLLEINVTNKANMTGSLVPEVGLLVNLEVLSMGHSYYYYWAQPWRTQISGGFPSSIQNLHRLRFLSLAHIDSLSSDDAPVPTEIGLLQNLEELDLSDSKCSCCKLWTAILFALNSSLLKSSKCHSIYFDA